MPLNTIPIQLHTEEIPDKGSQFESKWTPGDTIGKFQEWTRFWVRQDAEITKEQKVSTLLVHARPCVRDTQWKRNFLKKKFGQETYGEYYAPLDGEGSEVELLATTPTSLDAVLVWTEEDGYELDQESVGKLFTENVKIEQQGTAWVVYQKMLTSDEKIHARFDEERAEELEQERQRERLNVPDLRTGEMVINISPTGDIRQGQLDRAGLPLHKAVEQSKRLPDKKHNIAHAVNKCDSDGPFIGFKKLFTSEQLGQLHAADAELARDFLSQFQRLFTGHDLEQLFPIIDKGIDTHIVPLISKLDEGPIKSRIENAVQMWKENLENPYRNAGYRQREFEQLKETTGHLLKRNPRYFSLATVKNVDRENSFASWNSERFSLHAPCGDNNTYSFMDAVGVIHELTHTQQMLDEIGDTSTLSPEDIQRIIEKFQNQYLPINEEDEMKGMADIDFECETFAVMSELFSARLDDGDYTHDRMMRELQLPNTEHANAQVMQLSECATIYFNGGGRVGSTYSQAFVDYIEDAHKDKDCYTRTPDGKVVLVENAGINGLRHLYR